MSRVLAYTSPARGHLYPATSILLELVARGHEVHVRTLASEVPMLLGLGLSAAAIDPVIEARVMDDWGARTAQQGLARAVRTFADRAPHDAADLRAAIDELHPDLVLVDINSWGAIAAAEQWGGPLAVFCPYPLVLSSPDVPPFGPGLAPARGAPGRLRDRLLRPLVMGSIERVMLPPLNSLRTDLGLPGVGRFDEFLASIPLLLYLTAEPFEYARTDWPASVVMVGPCAWEPRAEGLDWLADLDRPTVLVTTSSEYQDDGRLVEAALEALADQEVHVVATMPTARMPARIPANATCFPTSRTPLCCSARAWRSRTRAWGPRRRRSRTGCRWSRCRSAGTSERSPDGSRSRARGSGSPRAGSARSGCARLQWRPPRCGRVPSEWLRGSPTPGVRPQPRTPWSGTWSRAGAPSRTRSAR